MWCYSQTKTSAKAVALIFKTGYTQLEQSKEGSIWHRVESQSLDFKNRTCLYAYMIVKSQHLQRQDKLPKPSVEKKGNH